MAKNSDHLAGSFDSENTGGVLSGFLAEEDEFDRRAMWRLGTWGVASVAAVVIAVMANQSSLGWRRDQMAAVDLVQQANRLQAIAKDSQNEARRLASAVDTLNSDRDRLYSRVTVLEQGLDSVTGTIAKQNPALAQPAVPPSRSGTGAKRLARARRRPGGDDAGRVHRKSASLDAAPSRRPRTSRAFQPEDAEQGRR